MSTQVADDITWYHLTEVLLNVINLAFIYESHVVVADGVLSLWRTVCQQTAYDNTAGATHTNILKDDDPQLLKARRKTVILLDYLFGLFYITRFILRGIIITIRLFMLGIIVTIRLFMWIVLYNAIFPVLCVNYCPTCVSVANAH